MVSAGVGYARLPWLGSGLSALALIVILYALWLEARTQRRRQDRRAMVRAAAAPDGSHL
jgi:hypothetical protein